VNPGDASETRVGKLSASNCNSVKAIAQKPAKNPPRAILAFGALAAHLAA
jgi:hypothetical protein